ncbi:MAG: type 1 periplasmic binding fold superfamily protein [Flavobacteriaceae bacterium]|jgi:hypothetical protein
MYFNQILNFKTLKVCFTLFMLAPFVLSCGSDDDAPPPAINEEEVITTVILTLTSNNGQEIVMTSQDLDGDGPNEPEITVSGNLSVATTYSGSVRLLNETVTPAENITDEVSAEGTEHQFFYTMGGGLNLTASYQDVDNNGNPIGILFDLTSTSASSGTLTCTLRHEPLKPNDGTLSGAGGDTDVSVSFPVIVE